MDPKAALLPLKQERLSTGFLGCNGFQNRTRCDQ